MRRVKYEDLKRNAYYLHYFKYEGTRLPSGITVWMFGGYKEKATYEFRTYNTVSYTRLQKDFAVHILNEEDVWALNDHWNNMFYELTDIEALCMVVVESL